MDSDLEKQKLELDNLNKKMAFEEEKLDLNFKLQSSLIVPKVSFLN